MKKDSTKLWLLIFASVLTLALGIAAGMIKTMSITIGKMSIDISNMRDTTMSKRQHAMEIANATKDYEDRIDPSYTGIVTSADNCSNVIKFINTEESIYYDLDKKGDYTGGYFIFPSSGSYPVGTKFRLIVTK